MSYPILKPNSTWFSPNVSTIKRSTITIINIVDTYVPEDMTAITDSWDASVAQDGGILCYVEGTVLTIAGNGSGKIAANEDASYTFSDVNTKDFFSALTELNDLSLIDFSNSTTIENIFRKLSSIENIDVSGIDTTNIATFKYAFRECTKLSSIDLSTWNTSKCESIYGMFYNCTSLTSIDVTGWDTPNMTNMAYAFMYCSSLTSLNVNNWNTSNVTDMKAMFNTCSKLESIDVSNWNTSNVTNMEAMFNKCSSLTTLDISNFNFSNTTTIRLMFQSCSSLQSLDVSKWDTSNITNMGYAFWGCKGLTSLAVEDWDVSNVESFDHTFAHCNNLVVDVTNWRPSSKCKYYTCLFHTNANEYLDVSGFDTSGAISMAMMFEANVNLKKIKGLEKFDTSNVASFQEMFFNCWNLEELDLSNFDTRKADVVTPIRSDGNSPSECTTRMLSGCRSLKKITLGENFTFAGDGTATGAQIGTLPVQGPTYVENADGNWYTLDGTAYTVNDIPNLTAATYYASASLAKYERNKNKLIDLNGLDSYHAENVKYIDEAVNAPKTELILSSSIEGSTKQFRITIGDDGVLTISEIVENET
jgi:surface protein